MTNNVETEQRITGKQVLYDAVTLLKDAGTYIYELSKNVVVKVKTLIVSSRNDDSKDDNDGSKKD